MAGYQDFLDDLAGDPKQAKEVPKAAPATHPEYHAREQLDEIPPLMTARKPQSNPTIMPVEELTISFDEEDFEDKPTKVATKATPEAPEPTKTTDITQLIGYKMTNEADLEAWGSLYERSLKARTNTPMVKKLQAGEFLIRDGNVEVISNLHVKLGPDAKPLDFFKQKWTD